MRKIISSMLIGASFITEPLEAMRNSLVDILGFNIEMWQMMSNIYSFMAMKMEDRRKYLINIAGGVNEDELMKPYPALLEAKASRKSIDELLSQTKTEFKKAKKEIDDIPTQIKAQDALKVSDENDICIDEDAIKDYYEKKNILNDKIATKRKELEENKSKRRQDACQKQYSLTDEVNRKKRLINKLQEDSVERIKSIDEITYPGLIGPVLFLILLSKSFSTTCI